jgi:hypothetical protein
MDSKLEDLTLTSELKTTLLDTLIREKKAHPSMSYDPDFDALIVSFAPDSEAIVHYINDEHVALLYQPDTKEIVGIQIEDFALSFLQHHGMLENVWRLSESDAKIENMGDLILAFERKSPQVAREVFRSTDDILVKQGLHLEKLFA